MTAAHEQLDGSACASTTRHADAHSLIGFVLGQQGELPSALQHLERAVALRPESAEAQYNLGVALWYSGARSGRLRNCGRACSSIRRRAPATRCSEPRCASRATWRGARASLQRAIALLPPTAAVYVDLGITYLRAGELDKAIGQLVGGFEPAAPAVPAPDWDAAIADLRRALVGESGRAEAHNVLGLLLGRKGASGDEVAAEFREAIRLRPDYAEAHNNLGLVLIQTGDDEAGIAALREAVRIAPDYADARANLGAALTPTDVDAAIRELEKAVELAPSSVKAHVQSGRGLRREPGARTREGNRAAPEGDRPRARRFRGRTSRSARRCFRTGKVPDAVTALQEAARLEPKSGEANYQLGLRSRARRAQGGGRGRAREGPRAGGGRRPQSERQPRHRRGPGGARARRAARPPPGSAAPSSCGRTRPTRSASSAGLEKTGDTSRLPAAAYRRRWS